MQDLEELYGLRSNFLIIGLTGRLGSGCSSTADLLTKTEFLQCGFPIPKNDNFESNEERKYRITYNFLQENWEKFLLIRASDIIVTLLLLKDFNQVVEYLQKLYSNQGSDVSTICQGFKEKFETVSEKAKKLFKNGGINNTYELEDGAYSDILESGEGTIRSFSALLKEKFKNITSSRTSAPFQTFGDNIRKIGTPIDNGDLKPNFKNSYIISDIIKQIIQQYRKGNNKKAKIVIDSIRNSFEARYFRERYSAFYLFAIGTENQYRIQRLAASFNADEIKNLDIEYDKSLKNSEIFYKQDIKSCIQMADIHLYNPNDDKAYGDTFKTIKMSIVRYLSLIYQPGLITPTSEERTMQIAYTAKYNSGCISRQVGAVVTDSFFSVKSIGWNNTPEGQTPCLLRNAEDLINNTDNISFSSYEKEDVVKKLVNAAILSPDKRETFLKGRNPCFCFKQVQNTIENQKNQVHTRSLHAEENAMLQISKYGGEGLKDGNLFTTASPCELCSKKAYQLGIKKVYYIDPYPGIASEQILDSGTRKPDLILFNGAVGKAYHSIFEPFMSSKDELELRLDVDYSKAKLELDRTDLNKKNKRISQLKEQKARIEKDIKYLEDTDELN